MIVAGLGFRASASTASLRDALVRAGVGDCEPLQALATVSTKATAPVLLAFAAEQGLPVLAITPESLMKQSVVTRSARVLALYGAGSVAEAAALAAAGPNARLLGPRVTSADGKATAALATGA